MAWRKRILTRGAEWTGMNGTHFDTRSFVDVIYYNKDELIKNRPLIEFGAEGAVVGGSTSIDDLRRVVMFIDNKLKENSPTVTVGELRGKIRKARSEMLRGEHKWNIPKYPSKDEWYNEPWYPNGV